MAAVTKSFTTSDGVTLQPFDPLLHAPTSKSHIGVCAQGGSDTCANTARFSITSESWNISSCPTHVYGALAEATTVVTSSS
jgi:hypothetical protein